MNAASQLSEAALLVSAGRGRPRAPVDAARDEDVYALWKEAFEHMRAVEARHDESSPSPARAAELQGRLASNAAAMRLTAAESVNVFVHGAAVAIVIRDAALSTQDAVHCAFETARELTGRRAALQHLRLNGHSIYRHSDSSTRDPMHGPDQSASVLVFAC